MPALLRVSEQVSEPPLSEVKRLVTSSNQVEVVSKTVPMFEINPSLKEFVCLILEL
jgi:hypothetical protein